MKTNFFAFSLLIFVFLTGWALQGWAQWEWVNPQVPAGNFTSCYFFSKDTGFVVTSPGALLKTENGGSSWTSIQCPVAASFYDIHFSSRDTGMIVGSSGTVLITTDGGQTWTSMPFFGQSIDLLKVRMIDAQKAFAIYDSIYYTSDGGANWSGIYYANSNLKTLYLTESGTGYVGVHDGRIIRFDTSGINQIYSVPWYPVNCIYFSNSLDTGLAVTPGSVYRSITGGSNWINTGLDNTCSFKHVSFVDSNHGFAFRDGCTNNNNIAYEFKTSDGGVNWTAIQINQPMDYITSAVFLDTLNGYILTSDEIYKTEDGGLTWVNTFPTLTSEDLNSVFFIDSLTGYIAGNNGTILKSTDQGDTWVILPNSIQKDLNSIAFINKDTGYVVGDQGSMYRTLDGGVIWDPVYTGTTSIILKICFPDEHTGYFHRPPYSFMKTIDGGFSWDSIAVFYSIINIDFCSADTGITSDCGSIYITTDGGITWDTSFAGCDYSLSNQILNYNHIFSANSTTDMIPCQSLTKSVDGGVSWDLLTEDYYIHNLFFIDSLSGVAFCTDPSFGIFNTIDGGYIWNFNLSCPRINSFGSVLNTIFAVGDNGTILKYTQPTGNGIQQYPKRSKKIMIYPNPASTELHVKIRGVISGAYTIMLYDIQGKPIHSITTKDTETVLDISQLPVGVYGVKVVGNGVYRMEKVVKVE